MKNLIYVFIGCVLSSHAWSAERTIEHLPVDMDGYEYRALWERHQKALPEAADELHEILQWGKRNLEWIETVNATRARGAIGAFNTGDH